MPPKPVGPSRNPSHAAGPRGQAASSQQGQGQSSSTDPQSREAGPELGEQKKKKRRRGGRNHKARRQSFAAPSEPDQETTPLSERPNLETVTEREQSSFYRVRNRAGSDSSLESQALLDHRYDILLSTEMWRHVLIFR